MEDTGLLLLNESRASQGVDRGRPAAPPGEIIIKERGEDLERKAWCR